MNLEDDRDLVEILAEEFLQLHRDGEPVSVSDYVKKYPEMAKDIEEVFPAMLAMEDAKPASVVAPQLDSFHAVARGKIKRLGDFRIIRKIAHGGMGIVYEAEEVSLDRKVAIKILATHLIADDSALKRFQREAKTIARLHHTNIVSVYGAGSENDLHFFVMEFIDGKSLDRMIKSGEFADRFTGDWNWIAEVAKRIALALRHAHQKNVLHRDVKPGNILIDNDRKPWVTDFGLAKFEENDDLTRPGDAVGTLRYMSPEQLNGVADERTDIYGLGMVLYEMLTGEKVFGDSEAKNLLNRIKNQDLVSPSRLNPEIPLDLERIALKAISVDPLDRYQEAVEFAEDLDRFQNDLPIRARKLSTVEACRRWAKRNPWIASLSAVVTCLLMILLFAFGSLAFAWLGKESAILDAKLAQRSAEESRKDAEASATKAISALDQLTNDLGVFNEVSDSDSTNQSFLFSPMGGIPVSRKTETQLDLILEFYHSIGKWSDQRDEIKYRRLLANIRGGEISLHLRDYKTARNDLAKVVDELRGETRDKKLTELRLYAKYLMGFANLLDQNYDEAVKNFKAQVSLIDSLDWDPEEIQVERGKVYLGIGILAHYRGHVRQWYDSILMAIGHLEQEVDYREPTKNPIAAVFLARCYLNVPPRFPNKNHEAFYHQCRTRAVLILHQLHMRQSDSLKSESDSSLSFLFDYCESVSALPTQVKELELGDNKSASVIDVLQDSIEACNEIVDTNEDAPAYRFAMAKCQMNLAQRLPERFDDLALKALNHLEYLTTNYPRDPIFLTECGNAWFRLGIFRMSARKLGNAKSAFQKSISFLNQSLSRSSSFPKTRMLLPEVNGKLAIVFDELNEPKKAAYHRSQKASLLKSFPLPNPENSAGQGNK